MIRIILTVIIIFAGSSIGCAQSAVPTPQGPQTFDECVAAGYPVTRSMPPRCMADGKSFEQKMPRPKTSATVAENVCKNKCGNGICEEIVCMAIGCPCPESPTSCPEDCK